MADSTSINLFKVLVAATRLRPGRQVIVAERDNFPTDAYIAASVAELTGCELRLVAADDVAAAIDESVAVVTLTQVDYRTGRRYDMAEVTRRAHGAGASPFASP